MAHCVIFYLVSRCQNNGGGPFSYILLSQIDLTSPTRAPLSPFRPTNEKEIKKDKGERLRKDEGKYILGRALTGLLILAVLLLLPLRGPSHRDHARDLGIP